MSARLRAFYNGGGGSSSMDTTGRHARVSSCSSYRCRGATTTYARGRAPKRKPRKLPKVTLDAFLGKRSVVGGRLSKTGGISETGAATIEGSGGGTGMLQEDAGAAVMAVGMRAVIDYPFTITIMPSLRPSQSVLLPAATTTTKIPVDLTAAKYREQHRTPPSCCAASLSYYGRRVGFLRSGDESVLPPRPHPPPLEAANDEPLGGRQKSIHGLTPPRSAPAAMMSSSTRQPPISSDSKESSQRGSRFKEFKSATAFTSAAVAAAVRGFGSSDGSSATTTGGGGGDSCSSGDVSEASGGTVSRAFARELNGAGRRRGTVSP
eukprot:GHVU01219189.1.p1 GENE.GHVU01219189.1~~GHVU01219189.1.p1  ORF type:complete len:371 (-),score=57.19 GHVU01219189.1:312-1274(-)